MENKKLDGDLAPVKAYTKKELASLYGVANFRIILRWLVNNKEFEEELSNTGYYSGTKILMPKQVEIVFQHAGIAKSPAQSGAFLCPKIPNTFLGVYDRRF